MNYGATITTTEENSHTCDNCGAELSVTYARQAGHNEREDYNCPECDKRYYVRASLPIMSHNVKVIKARTDGKNDRYQKPD
jgi:ribosomal protein L37AE/L43A